MNLASHIPRSTPRLFNIALVHTRTGAVVFRGAVLARTLREAQRIARQQHAERREGDK